MRIYSDLFCPGILVHTYLYYNYLYLNNGTLVKCTNKIHTLIVKPTNINQAKMSSPLLKNSWTGLNLSWGIPIYLPWEPPKHWKDAKVAAKKGSSLLKRLPETLFRNKRFALNEMFQRNSSKFWSISQDHFVVRKPLISEEWSALLK